MARSLKKGPFVDDHLMKKVEVLNKEEVSEMTYTTNIDDYLTFVCEEDRERIQQAFEDVHTNKIDKINAN